jgi:hypothetical protein
MRGWLARPIARLGRKGTLRDTVNRGRTLLRRSEVETFKPKPPGPLLKMNASKRRRFHIRG